MAIDEKRVAKMKQLVENAKKSGAIIPSKDAFLF